MKLTDEYNRTIKKLRVSLLDSCNFRCLYCLPLKASFLDSKKWLSFEEIYNICSTLTSYGIDELRVTGGEPTLRPNFIKIMESLASLNVKKLGLTSNGFLLKKHLPLLKEYRCDHLNISLDSLNPDKFKKITRKNGFHEVMETILQAKAMDFNIKLNVVAMKGHNDDEILDFSEFSKKNDIEVRFLEVMKIGEANKGHEKTFISADEIINIIKSKSDINKISSPLDSTSFRYRSEDGVKIGFIASESKPFCGGCSRWRLSADGHLRACLMSEKGVSLKNIPKEQYPDLLKKVLPMKPSGRIKEVFQNMNVIGG